MHNTQKSGTMKKLVHIGINNHILQATNIDEVDIDADLVEQSLVDSMGVILLQCMLDEEYGLEVSKEQFIADLRTIRKIGNYIDERTPMPMPEKYAC